MKTPLDIRKTPDILCDRPANAKTCANKWPCVCRLSLAESSSSHTHQVWRQICCGCAVGCLPDDFSRCLFLFSWRFTVLFTVVGLFKSVFESVIQHHCNTNTPIPNPSANIMSTPCFSLLQQLWREFQLQDESQCTRSNLFKCFYGDNLNGESCL